MLPTDQPLSDPALWARLATWRAGEDAKALAAEAMRALRIYPRTAEAMLDAYAHYAYLAMIAPEPVVAPRLVVEAALLHAAMFHAFTDRFQGAVLKGPLPRAAFEIRPASDPSHAQARALYTAEFGEPPLPAVWHGPAQVLHLRAMWGLAAAVIAGILLIVWFGPAWSDLALRLAVGGWVAGLAVLVGLVIASPYRPRERTYAIP